MATVMIMVTIANQCAVSAVLTMFNGGEMLGSDYTPNKYA